MIHLLRWSLLLNIPSFFRGRPFGELWDKPPGSWERILVKQKRRLAARMHPEKGGNRQQFEEMQRSADLLRGRLQPGNQWQVSFLELAYAAVWNSSRDEFLSAVSVWVLPRKTKAIIRNVAYQKWATISWGTTKNQQAEDNGIVWFLMVPQRKRLEWRFKETKPKKKEEEVLKKMERQKKKQRLEEKQLEFDRVLAQMETTKRWLEGNPEVNVSAPTDEGLNHDKPTTEENMFGPFVSTTKKSHFRLPTSKNKMKWFDSVRKVQDLSSLFCVDRSDLSEKH